MPRLTDTARLRKIRRRRNHAWEVAQRREERRQRKARGIPPDVLFKLAEKRSVRREENWRGQVNA